MRSAACFCLLILFFGCGEKSEEKEKRLSLPQDTSPVQVEMIGDIDPIANPNAVKGGTFTTWGSSFPKSLNMFLDYNSFSEEVTGLLFEPLAELHSTRNEPIGVLAESWQISDDKTTFTFKIHPEARWSDGKAVTAEDIQFYYDVMMNPKNMTSIFRVSLKRFDRPRIVDDRTIEISAKTPHWKNFWDACDMTALPRHIWNEVDFNRQNFEFPVVSGPYMLKEVKKNRNITLERRTDWWGRIKRYNQHKFNFDIIRYRFMEDRNKALEAFKKGEFDAYAIYTSSIWAKKTDFNQIEKGWVVKQRVYNKEPKGFQGFAINMRRPVFQDAKVREALSHLLNRESMNEKLMFNEYFLLNSYYSDLYPENRNPDVPLRGYDPEKARVLLHDAGWVVGDDGFLIKDGDYLEIKFLTHSVDLRHLNIYLEDLKKVGIKAGVDQLSLSSVRKRLDNHDFDLYWVNWGASRLRDPEAMWHSGTADQIATNNYSGVKDSVIDGLIEAQKTEMDLDRRNEILKKIDMKLNEIIPYIFLWQADHNRMLYWNRFGTPRHVFDKFNRENVAIIYWWMDPEKDRALKMAMENGTVLSRLPERVVYAE
jgi:microcin C transport system substrate-binding protein